MLKLRFDRRIKTKSCTNRFFLTLEAAFFHSYNLQFHFVVVVLIITSACFSFIFVKIRIKIFFLPGNSPETSGYLELCEKLRN